MKVCRGCLREFDHTKFGSSFYYCSKLCRYTNGGLKDVTRKRGRPRRFPLCSDADIDELVAWMQKYGWALAPAHNLIGQRVDSLWLARYKHFLVKICFGGAAIFRRAHVVAFFNTMPSGVRIPVVASSCDRRAYDDLAFKGKRQGNYKRRAACGDIVKCPKCRAAQWVHTINKIAVEFIPEDIRSGDPSNGPPTQEAIG